MTPDQPGNYGDSSGAFTGATGSEPTHRQIQGIHDKYFQDLAAIWNEMQQHFQAIQTEFERAVENGWQTQDPSAYQAALADYQQAFQAACMEASMTKRYDDAYRDYKTAIQQAIAQANVDDLNFTDIAHISQSLYAVMQTALMLTAPRVMNVGASPFPFAGQSSNQAL